MKTGANTWAYEVSYQGDAANISPATNPIATGTMTFNSDGTLANADTIGGDAAPARSASRFRGTAASGLQPQTISLNMGTVGSSDGVTQFDSASTLVSSNVDGALFGSLTGVTDRSRRLRHGELLQRPVAEDLQAAARDLRQSGRPAARFPATPIRRPTNSGTPTISEANTGGAGAIAVDALEGSTVDLATEFTNLITTQRAYSGVGTHHDHRRPDAR